jgi:hypothetical protein
MSYKQSLWYGVAAGALLGATLLAPGRAAAQSNQDLSVQVDQLRQQVQQLQQQLQLQQPTPSATGPQAPGSEVAQTNGSAPLPNGAIQLGGVRLQLGGFIEAATIWRSRNEVSDVGSDYNTGIPFNNSPLAHQNEFRESARQSRIAGLVSGDVDQDTHLAAYIETDFLSAAATSNSRESNSYSLRVRHAYTTLDLDDWGLHILAGQNWSLLTTNTAGIIPRQEQIPLTIDAQYVEGFNWKRQAQIRLVKNWGNLWAGISVENPEFSTASTTPAGVNVNNTGDAAGLENPSTTYSNNFMPDIIGKIAVDPGFGHYELKGLVRGFSSSLNGTTSRVIGYGGGAAATFPVVPKFVDFQLSGLIGDGIGTYGSGGLPDVAFNRNDKVVAVPEVQGLAGIITHPWVGNDLYLYGGWEHADRAGAPGTAGYGSGSLVNTGCDILGATTGTTATSCNAETEDLKQLVIGTWQNVYKGNFGRFVVGLQGSYIERDAFTGVGGAPSTNETIVMTSIRYYPF